MLQSGRSLAIGRALTSNLSSVKVGRGIGALRTKQLNRELNNLTKKLKKQTKKPASTGAIDAGSDRANNLTPAQS
jgi:hypothetical protein